MTNVLSEEKNLREFFKLPKMFKKSYQIVGRDEGVLLERILKPISRFLVLAWPLELYYMYGLINGYECDMGFNIAMLNLISHEYSH